MIWYSRERTVQRLGNQRTADPDPRVKRTSMRTSNLGWGHIRVPGQHWREDWESRRLLPCWFGASAPMFFLTFILTFGYIFGKLWEARSRLYRRQILQVNIRWKGFKLLTRSARFICFCTAQTSIFQQFVVKFVSVLNARNVKQFAIVFKFRRDFRWFNEISSGFLEKSTEKGFNKKWLRSHRCSESRETSHYYVLPAVNFDPSALTALIRSQQNCMQLPLEISWFQFRFHFQIDCSFQMI